MLEKLKEFEIQNPQTIYGGRDHAENDGIPPDNSK